MTKFVILQVESGYFSVGEGKLSAAGIRFPTPARARLSMLEDLLDMSLDGMPNSSQFKNNYFAEM